MVLSLIGKFGASASFAIVYVYTAEMFPTTRIGGITSLLLDLLKVYWLPAPLFIMGVVATIAGAVAVFFPETLGQKLPDKMEEALRFRCFAKFIDFKFPPIRIGENSTRGFCTFTCTSVKELFNEELKTVPREGVPCQVWRLEKV